MWHTPNGERCLNDNEKNIWIHAVTRWLSDLSPSVYFQETLSNIKQIIEEEGEHPLNSCFPKPFSSMPTEQQIIAVSVVSQALISPTSKPIKLSAWSEATFAAMCDCLKIEISMDIEETSRDVDHKESQIYLYNRWFIHDFCLNEIEVDGDDHFDYYPDSPECDDAEKWNFLIEYFMDGILRGRDYELEDTISDSENSLLLKTMLRIPEDYLADIPPIDTESNYLEAVRYLVELHSEHSKEYAKFKEVYL